MIEALKDEKGKQSNNETSSATARPNSIQSEEIIFLQVRMNTIFRGIIQSRLFFELAKVGGLFLSFLQENSVPKNKTLSLFQV